MTIFLSCLIISLFFCFNGYLFGRFIKKLNYKINDSLVFVFGSFSVIAILQLLLIPVLLLKIDYKFFAYYFIVFQSLLIILYVFNWRHNLNIKKINLIKLIHLLVGLIIVFVVMFALKDYNYNNLIQENISWTQIVFNEQNKSIIEKLSNLSLLITKNINISLAKQYILMLPFALIIVNTVYGMYQDKYVNKFNIKVFFKQNNKYFFMSYISLILLISILSLWMYTNPSNGSIWILISIFLFWICHKNSFKELNPNIYAFLINGLSLGIFSFAPESILCIFVLNIYFLYSNHRNKLNNLFDYNIIMVFGALISISLGLNYYLTRNEDGTNYIGYIACCIFIFLYLIYFFFRTTRIFKKIWNFRSEQKNGYYDVILYLAIIFLFLTMALITFINNNEVMKWDYWIISQFVNKTLSVENNIVIYYIVNVMWWIGNVFVLLLSIFEQFIKQKRELNTLQIINNVTAWNPVGTQFWYKITPNNLLVPNNVNLTTNNSVIGTSYLIMILSEYLYNINSKNKLIIILTPIITLAIFIGMTLINFIG